MAAIRAPVLLAALALAAAAQKPPGAQRATRLPDAILFPPAGSAGAAASASGGAPGGQQGGALSARLQPRRPLGRATAALRGMAARLRALLGPGDVAGNLLLSPLSVAAALGQLLLGARGQTRALLSDLLDAPGPERVVPRVSLGGEPLVPDLEYHQQFKALLALLAAEGGGDGAELRLASAFFAQRDLPLRTDFQHALRDLYHADVRPLDFRESPALAAAAVNEWARQATRGRIATVLAQPLPPSTAALVASAVYFRGVWEWPFDSDLTVSGWFKVSPQRRVASKFMRGHFPEMRVYDAPGLGYRLAVLPYKGGNTAMYVALPDDKGVDLKDFAAAVAMDGMLQAARAARARPVSLVMPKMNIAGSFSLKEPLSNLNRLRRLPRSAPEPRAQDASSPLQNTAGRDSPDVSLTPSPVHGVSAVPEFGPLHVNSTLDDPISLASAATSLNRPVVVGVPLRIMDVEDSHSSTKSQSNNYYYQGKENGKTVPASLRDTEVPYPYRPGSNQSRKSSSEKSTKATSTVKDSATSSFPKMIVGSFFDFQSSNASVPGVFKDTTRPSILRKMLPDLNSNERGNCTASADMAITDSSSPVNTATKLMTVISVNSSSSTSKSNISSLAQEEKLGAAAGGEAQSAWARGALPAPAPVDAASPAQPQLNALAAGAHGAYGVAPRPLPPPGAAPYGDVQLDLTGASNDTLRVSDALHHVWLEVTETGTEAAAVTASIVDYSGDSELIVVDRPFVAAIVHEPSGALLFWAAVVDPTGGAGVRTDAPAQPPSKGARPGRGGDAPARGGAGRGGRARGR